MKTIGFRNLFKLILPVYIFFSSQPVLSMTCLKHIMTFFVRVDSQRSITRSRSYKYVNYSQLEQLSLIELHDELRHFQDELITKEDALPRLESAREHLRELIKIFISQPKNGKSIRELTKEQIKYEKSIGLKNAEQAYAQTAEDIQHIRQHIDALSRCISRKQSNEVSPFVNQLQIDGHVPVSSRNRVQIYAQIRSVITSAGINPEKVFIRFFSSAREDIVRLHGTDKAGSRNNYKASDIWGLAEILESKGLSQEDGFYALPFNFCADPQNPFPMISDFINGTKSIAVYDETKFEDPNTDYIFFLNPSKKQEALLGVLSPSP